MTIQSFNHDDPPKPHPYSKSGIERRVRRVLATHDDLAEQKPFRDWRHTEKAEKRKLFIATAVILAGCAASVAIYDAFHHHAASSSPKPG